MAKNWFEIGEPVQQTPSIPYDEWERIADTASFYEIHGTVLPAGTFDIKPNAFKIDRPIHEILLDA